ncbi:ABC transporter substrate-binding protein [Streptomyces sp. NPDC004609]|uniref:ABC transporter substrate-binding protein n=1 Tax=Streptomyces sp. NPDC004609 TaxID=3364704 RepID=UPI003681A658
MHRRFSVLAVTTMTTVTAAVAAGCSAGSSANGNSGPAGYAKDGTFTYTIPSDPGAIDPYRNISSINEMGSLVYDPLVNVTPEGKIVSGLAERWQVDARGATFTLREGITCSDGTPLTARQVAAALTFLKDPKNQSPLYGLLVPATAFTVTADDTARTVKVTMQEPFALLLQTIGRTPIVCDKGMKNPKSLAKSSAGTGPYVLSDVVRGDHYTFTRRAGYTWGPAGVGNDAPGTPARVVVKIVPNETTAANLLLSGEVNMAAVRGADRKRLEARELKHFTLSSTLGELWFNQRDGRPGADPKVRKALITALDLDELARVSTGGQGKRAEALVANDSQPCAANNVEGLPRHDARQAAALLDQAGWTAGSKGIRGKGGKQLKVSLHYSSNEGKGNVAAAEVVSQRWKDLGVSVELVGDDLNSLNRAMFETGDFDVYWAGFKLNLPHLAVPFASGAVPPAGQNFTGIKNPSYDSLVARAARTAGEAGCKLWNDAERSLIAASDVVPVSEAEIPYFLNKGEAKTEGWLQIPIPTSLRVLR